MWCIGWLTTTDSGDSGTVEHSRVDVFGLALSGGGDGGVGMVGGVHNSDNNRVLIIYEEVGADDDNNCDTMTFNNGRVMMTFQWQDGAKWDFASGGEKALGEIEMLKSKWNKRT